MKYRILDSGKKSAFENMEEDFFLLKNTTQDSPPILRFYEWTSFSATHGYFMDPLCYLDLAASKKYHLQVARRPTGGGLLFHFLDFTFSLIIPSGHPEFLKNVKESYRFVNEKVVSAIKSVFNTPLHLIQGCAPSRREGFCMAKPTIFDIMLGEKKVGGAAQRRTKDALLHQGSINLGLLEENILLELLPKHTHIVQDIKNNSISLLGKTSPQELQNVRKELKEKISYVLNHNARCK